MVACKHRGKITGKCMLQLLTGQVFASFLWWQRFMVCLQRVWILFLRSHSLIWDQRNQQYFCQDELWHLPEQDETKWCEFWYFTGRHSPMSSKGELYHKRCNHKRCNNKRCNHKRCNHKRCNHKRCKHENWSTNEPNELKACRWQLRQQQSHRQSGRRHRTRSPTHHVQMWCQLALVMVGTHGRGGGGDLSTARSMIEHVVGANLIVGLIHSLLLIQEGHSCCHCKRQWLPQGQEWTPPDNEDKDNDDDVNDNI